MELPRRQPDKETASMESETGDQGVRGALDTFDTQEVGGQQMKMKKASPTKEFINQINRFAWYSEGHGIL